jgi:putative intracellular protease/amidase
VSGDAVLVLYPGCVFLEASAAVSLLSSRHRLVCATPDGGPVRVEEGFVVQGDAAIGDVDLVNTAFVLVPGGNCDAIIDDDALALLLTSAARQDVVVGAICNGALLLAKAGLLAGKRCTHTATPAYAPLPEFAELLAAAGPLLAGSTFVDEDVVTDGRIVTAKPWAFVAFAKAVARAGGTPPPGHRLWRD